MRYSGAWIRNGEVSMGLLILCGSAPVSTLSEAEQKLLARIKLKYNEPTWKELERILNKEQARFETTSTVDEHCIRQEAMGLGIRLPR